MTLTWRFASIALIAFGALVSIANWFLIGRYLLTRQRSSLVPLVGGLSLSAGLFLLPSPTLISRLWYLGFIIDVGTLPAIVATVASRALREKDSKE